METIDERTKKGLLLGIFLFFPLLLFWAAPAIRHVTESFIDPIPQVSFLQTILIILSIIDIAFPWFLEKLIGPGAQAKSGAGLKLFIIGLFFEVSPCIYGLLLFLFGSSLITLYMFVGLSFVATLLWGLHRINADEYI